MYKDILALLKQILYQQDRMSKTLYKIEDKLEKSNCQTTDLTTLVTERKLDTAKIDIGCDEEINWNDIEI